MLNKFKTVLKVVIDSGLNIFQMMTNFKKLDGICLKMHYLIGFTIKYKSIIIIYLQ
jgi:hypothetical protein